VAAPPFGSITRAILVAQPGEGSISKSFVARLAEDPTP
jgi:hypothetical protein